MDCSCPSGFSKFLVKSSTTTISDVRGSINEWRHNYTPGSSGGNYPLCDRIATTSPHQTVVSYYGGFCYKQSCFECFCNGADAIADDAYYNIGQQARSKVDFHKSSIIVYLLSKYYGIPDALADDVAHGCGLITMYQTQALPRPQDATIETWVCINANLTATTTGWDN